MRFLLLLLAVFGAAVANAQDISGRWEGNFNSMFQLAQPQKIVAELTVYQDSLISGITHLYYEDGNYEHYLVSGYYDRKNGGVVFSEDSTISVRGAQWEYCRGKYLTALIIKDSVMRLEGRWKSHNILCPNNRVWFEMKAPPSQSVTIAAKPKDQLPDRREEVQKLLEIATDEKDSIKIELLDNAQIDNDVVSVYLNDAIVLRKHKLTAEPAAFWLSLNKSADIATIRMAAESMGSIPPCTALMVVTTKKNRYTVTLSSDMGNTGTLKLFLRQ